MSDSVTGTLVLGSEMQELTEKSAEIITCKLESLPIRYLYPEILSGLTKFLYI